MAKKIKLFSWEEKAGKEIVKMGTIDVIKSLFNTIDPQKIPKGLDNYRLTRRISNAFNKAEKSEFLYLDGDLYEFLKAKALENMPSNWALNENISQAIDLFLDAEEYDLNEK